MGLFICLQFKHLLSLLVQGWGQIILPKTGSFGKSEQGSCLCEVRRREEQDKHFRKEDGEDVVCG